MNWFPNKFFYYSESKSYCIFFHKTGRFSWNSTLLYYVRTLLYNSMLGLACDDIVDTDIGLQRENV